MYKWSATFLTNNSFAQKVTVTGMALTVLFTIMAPQASEPLTLLPRLAFWSLHIGLGLVAANVAARGALAVLPTLRDWRLIFVSGVGGASLFGPVAYGIEYLFPLAVDEADTDWAARVSAIAMPAAILVETLEMAPSYLAAWAVINLQPFSDAWRRATAADREPRRQHVAANPADTVQTSLTPTHRLFAQRLPPAIGTDIVAVSSDLHYLNVFTTTGQAQILGTLKDVEEAFGDDGLRVHRSHWVRQDAVLRLRKSGSGWALELAGGHRVPVSRRKRRDVIAQFGADFERHPSNT